MDRFIVSLNRCNELSLDNDEIVIENDWETRISIPILTFILLLLRRRSKKFKHRSQRQNRAYVCTALSRALTSHLIYTLVLLNRMNGHLENIQMTRRRIKKCMHYL